jgi:hypothetical protein
MVGFVVGLSAMMASTQSLVNTVNHTAGVTLAIVGIVSAGASMVCLVIGKIIIVLEAASVKNKLMGI